MSGHSKWAQIKRQKGVTDSKRGAAFTKLANAITIAAREGGKDPNFNVRLRLAVEKARAANMPKENIERAVKRGVGELEGQTLAQVTYEGYGPGGVAIVAEALTDNRNRTSAELRKVFSDCGGSLGNANSVLWMFKRRGVLVVAADEKRQAIELAAIDTGAEDIREEAGQLLIITAPADITRVQETVKAAGAKIESAAVELISSTTVTPASDAERQKIHELLGGLEELNDVTEVATNADV